VYYRKVDNLGSPWSQMTKYKKAKKTIEFGKWSAEHEVEYLRANPFKILPNNSSRRLKLGTYS
jgi:hypothetical protein